MREHTFSGSITALVTPFKDGQLDEEIYCALVERQIGAGTHGLVPVGTTGESPTLSHAEHKRVVELCIQTTAGRVPVIAGAGSNATSEAVALAKFAQRAGADALLTVTGYYNKPQQEGLFVHFQQVSAAVGIPIILYNVPGRTNSDIAVETMARLASVQNIVGVKDATGDLARVAAQRVACGPEFIQLSGEDLTAVGFNAMGGQGCISVTANLVPELCAQLQEACLSGAWDTARQLQDRLTPLHQALFCEINPGPVKYAMSRLGLCQEDVRSPLVEISTKSKSRIDSALVKLGLL